MTEPGATAGDPAAPTTVLVVDDQVLIRAGVAALLRAAPGLDVVGEAGDGEQAVALAASTRPDVVLMDIHLPGVNGIEATRRILADAGDAPPRVLILTMYDLDEYVYDALRAGASGFLLKDTPPERLLTAVRTVATGDMLFAPSVTRRLIEAYVNRSVPAKTPDELTKREVLVLRMVGRGMANAEIAETLDIAETTVKTHVNRIMTKLRLNSRAQAVVYAYETGLVSPSVSG
ncbi:response regulator [Actinoallomurus iriomotensis]|uniref:DNA-binding response regulator n=1 Tax=Actinoallomurus iriomotensis TaxID=478107 RepID=A0A9W6W3Q7_9ACTN|nr:response regulator transcription factor [Actinoallomurus iriomotensis]GLY88221.1 DNA-binding response regulator [Actinoallomurus iriomotensis]